MFNNYIKGFAIGSLIKYAIDLPKVLRSFGGWITGTGKYIDATSFLRNYQPALQRMSLEDVSRLRGAQAYRDTGIDPASVQKTIYDLPPDQKNQALQNLRNLYVRQNQLPGRTLGATYLTPASSSEPLQLPTGTVDLVLDYTDIKRDTTAVPLQDESLAQALLGHELAHAQQVIPSSHNSFPGMLLAIRQTDTKETPSYTQDAKTPTGRSGQPSENKQLQIGLDTLRYRLASLFSLMREDKEHSSILDYALTPSELTARCTNLQRVYDNISGKQMSSVPELVDFYSQRLSEILDATYPAYIALVTGNVNPKAQSVLKFYAGESGSSEAIHKIPAVVPTTNRAWMDYLARYPQMGMAIEPFISTQAAIFNACQTALWEYMDAIVNDDVNKATELSFKLEPILRQQLPRTRREFLTFISTEAYQAPPEIKKQLQTYNNGKSFGPAAEWVAYMAKKATEEAVRDILKLGFVGSSRLVRSEPAAQQQRLPA